VIVDYVVALCFEERGHALCRHRMHSAVEVHAAQVHGLIEWGAQLAAGCGVTRGVEGEVVAPLDKPIGKEADDPLYPAVSFGWYLHPGWGYLRYLQGDLAFLAICADALLDLPAARATG
jgi:hypothetical protein